MAGRPLRPATDRRLGGLLPRQLANRTSAAPIARGLAVPRFHPWVVCGISLDFSRLSPTTGHVPMCYSPVRHSTWGLPPFRVRLACVRHAASVQSEPGSNSSVESCLDRVCDQRYTLATSCPAACAHRMRSLKVLTDRSGKIPKRPHDSLCERHLSTELWRRANATPWHSSQRPHLSAVWIFKERWLRG